MIEKYIQPKTMRPLKYILGAIIEVIGLALLFSFDKTMIYVHQYPIVFAVILIIGGYFLAISGRRM